MSDKAAHQITKRQCNQGGDKEAEPCSRRLQIKAQNILKIRQAVVPTKSHVIAEEGQQQGISHGLRDNRKIYPGHPRTESKPAKDKSEEARHDDHHQHGKREHIEPVPIPRQLSPVQEHHEIRQNWIAIDTAISDLAHQVHPHGITT